MTSLERAIGIVLRTGVAISSTCLALGLVLALIGTTPPFANGLLHVGLIVLLCTPVARVVISTIEYSLARDWPFATLTLIVLAELLASAVAALVFNKKL